MRTVVGVTGASGAIYAVRLLEHLQGEKLLVLSKDGAQLVRHEWGPVDRFRRLADKVYSNDDFRAPIASGSHQFDGMVIVPCSTTTLSKLAAGIADNLITRTAHVCLKERRKLIVVPREAPLDSLSLRNLAALSDAGAVILPAAPGFYTHPKTIDDLVLFVVQRILDQLGQQSDVAPRWGGPSAAGTRSAGRRPGGRSRKSR